MTKRDDEIQTLFEAVDYLSLLDPTHMGSVDKSAIILLSRLRPVNDTAAREIDTFWADEKSDYENAFKKHENKMYKADFDDLDLMKGRKDYKSTCAHRAQRRLMVKISEVFDKFYIKRR